eukprot:s4627_g2.t1
MDISPDVQTGLVKLPMPVQVGHSSPRHRCLSQLLGSVRSLSLKMSAPETSMKRLQLHKQTRLCKFFSMGACTRGEKCAFAHGLEHLRQQPDFSKTRLCADFMESGTCAQGRKCKFAHGKRELRPGSAAKIGRPARVENAKEPSRPGKGERHSKEPSPCGPEKDFKASELEGNSLWSGLVERLPLVEIGRRDHFDDQKRASLEIERTAMSQFTVQEAATVKAEATLPYLKFEVSSLYPKYM